MRACFRDVPDRRLSKGTWSSDSCGMRAYEDDGPAVGASLLAMSSPAMLCGRVRHEGTTNSNQANKLIARDLSTSSRFSSRPHLGSLSASTLSRQHSSSMSLHARTPSSPRLPTTTGGGHSAPTPSPLSSSSATVHQQQQHQHRRTKPSTPGAQTLSSVLKKIALVGFLVVAVWWIYVWKRCVSSCLSLLARARAVRALTRLYATAVSSSGVVQDFFDPNDKIQRSRPAFRYVEP